MAPDEPTNKAAFAVSMTPPDGGDDLDGFNEHGVRENRTDDGDLESIDVIFDAMQPGVRKQIEVTSEFLRDVASRYRETLPSMVDHSQSQLKHVGEVTDVKYSDFSDSLRLKVNIPNTGNSVKGDVIADFTHTPPAIQDGSVGFDVDSLEFEEAESEDAVARFSDGRLEEFSLTPFPAGYDDGGLSPVFSEAIEDSFADDADGDDGDDAESQLVVNDSKLTTTN